MKDGIKKNGKHIRLHEDSIDNDISSDVTELTQLRPRGSVPSLQSYSNESTKSLPANVVYLEREIMPNDTLQSFALLYGCSVNDIKRANNLIQELDFFALRRLKIPVKRHGLLTEPEEELKRRPLAIFSSSDANSAPTSSYVHKKHLKGFDDDEDYLSNDVYHKQTEDFDSRNSSDHSRLLSSESPVHSKDSAIDNNDASKFLKKVDKEIQTTVRKSDKLETERNEALEEVVSSLGSVGYRPLPLPSSRSQECDGATWGVKWWTLMLCFLVVMIVVVFVIIEMYMQHKELFPDEHSKKEPGNNS